MQGNNGKLKELFNEANDLEDGLSRILNQNPEEKARREARERAITKLQSACRVHLARIEAKKARIEADEQARIEADEQARKEEEKARREAEEKARKEAEERPRIEEEKARREAEEQEKIDADERARKEAEEQKKRKLAIKKLQLVNRGYLQKRRGFKAKKTKYQAIKLQLDSRFLLARKAFRREQEKIEQFYTAIINPDQQYLFFRQKKYSNNEKFSFSVQSDQKFDTQKTPSETDGAAVEKKTFDQLSDQHKLKTYQNKIDQALNIAISETKDQFKVDGKTDQSNIDLPENFFVVVMQIASFNRGIGNCDENKIKKQLASLLDLKTESNQDKIDQLYQASKFFSKTFQQKVEFYTGNTSENAKRDTKMRLFRASTYENIERLFQRNCSSKSTNSALQIGARNVGVEFKKLFETNSKKLEQIGEAKKTSFKARSASTLAPPRSLSTPP